MTYMLGPCSVKGCSRHHGVTVRPASRSAAQVQPRQGRRGTPERLREASDASAVSPPGDADSSPRPVAARSGSGVLPAETPRDGRETVTDSPLGLRVPSRPSQAASPRASRSGRTS